MPGVPAPLPARFGPWQVLCPLGRGGMGQVYLAEHETDGSRAAVKTVQLPRAGDIASLRREVQLLRRVHHPGVVQVLDDGFDQGQPWFAMAWVAGVSLDAAIADRWVPPWDPSQASAPPLRPSLSSDALGEVLTQFRRLCQTLTFLHGEGVVHRDVKPANVLLDGRGVPVLVDFGIGASFAGGSGRERLDVAAPGGTLSYVAPEQLDGRTVDARADLYALGCMLFEAITGAPPFGREASLARILREPAPAASDRVAGVPPALDDLLRSLLQKDPADRLGHADEVGRLLEAMGGLPHPALAHPRPRPFLYRPRVAGRRDVLEPLAARARALPADPSAGGLVLLVGPRGAGKTRLATELAAHATRHAVTLASGTCERVAVDGTRHDQPLQPFRPLLQRVVDRCFSSPERAPALLGPLGRALAEVEPAIARLPLAPLAPLVGDAARERRLQALLHVLGVVAAEQPLVFVLDDLQWADDATLEAVSLLARAAEVPCLLLATVRSGEVPAPVQHLVEAGDADRVDLGTLPDAGVVSMVRDVLGDPSPPGPLLEHVRAHAEGRPLFVGEFLHAAIATGLLARDDAGRWTLAGPVERLPADPRAAIVQRLGQLSEAALHTARGLAVLGRVAPAAALERVVGEAGGAGLDELLVGRIVEDLGQGRVAFLHDVLREHVYAGTPAHLRRDLHRLAAEVLAETGADPGTVALHHDRGGHADLAFRWFERAGEEALARGDVGAAERALGRALELAAGGEVPVEDPRLAVLLRHRAVARVDLGDVGRGLEDLREGLARLGRPLPRPLGVGLVLRQVLRQVRLRWLGPGRRRSPRDLLALEAELADRLTGAAVLRNEGSDAMVGALLAANAAEEAGASAPLASGSAFLGMMIGTLGLQGLASRYFERARKASADTSDVEARVRVGCIESYHLLMQCRFERALPLAEAALDEARAAVSHHHARLPLYQLGLIAQESGDLPAARRWTDQLLHQARGLGSRWGLGQGSLLAVRQALLEGDLEAADRTARAALALVDAAEDAPLHLNLLAGQAMARWLAGAADEALELLDAVEGGLDRLPGDRGVAYNAVVLVPELRLEAWARAGDVGAARHAAAAQEALEHLARAARLFRLARPTLMRLRGTRLLLLGRTGQGVRTLRRARARARRLGMPYEEARAALALAEAPGVGPGERAEAAAAARAWFEAAGPRWSLRRLDAPEDLAAG